MFNINEDKVAEEKRTGKKAEKYAEQPHQWAGGVRLDNEAQLSHTVSLLK